MSLLYAFAVFIGCFVLVIGHVARYAPSSKSQIIPKKPYKII